MYARYFVAEIRRTGGIRKVLAALRLRSLRKVVSLLHAPRPSEMCSETNRRAPEARVRSAWYSMPFARYVEHRTDVACRMAAWRYHQALHGVDESNRPHDLAATPSRPSPLAIPIP